MGLFSSKTKYYVSSSTCAIFDQDNRINQYQSAMLDWTQNSEYEHYEYMKNFYDTSRLRGFRSFLTWWEKQDNYDTFGNITSTFYNSPSTDNSVIAEAIRDIVGIPSNAVTFTVYNSSISYFSVDFWIKYLATQQGKVDWVYQGTDADYELEWSDDDTVITATFTDGRVISGNLPSNYSYNNSRFLNISYSWLTQETTESSGDGGTTITVTSSSYHYGYYCYQEGTGNSTLDAIIASGISTGDSATFYPVIPLRTDSAWYTGDTADKINDALDFLEIVGDKEDYDTSYEYLQYAIEEGIEDGDIGDVDYATLVLSIAINSNHSSDTKYLYNFFYNLHTNYGLQNTTPISGANTIYSTIEDYLSAAIGSYTDASGVYQESSSVTGNRSFEIRCTSSNLDLVYDWDGSIYVECNGQFKPDAEVGDYGVLSGKFTYSWVAKEPSTDSEGNVVTRCDEDGCEIVYENVKHSTSYNMIVFCHQYAENRWHGVIYIGLYLTNLIYHGKSIGTDAVEAHQESSSLGTVTHNFHSPAEANQNINVDSFTFSYIIAEGDLSTGFIIPLEQTSFYAIGVVDGCEVSYGSQFIVFNCWESKKVKWYQRGWIGQIISFVGLVISIYFGFAPGIAFFGAMFLATMALKLLEMALSILTTIFGESLGTQIYNWILMIVKIALIIISIVWPPAALVCAVVMYSITAGQVLMNGGSLTSAMVKGFIAAAATYAASTFGPTEGSQILTETTAEGTTSIVVGEGAMGAVGNYGLSVGWSYSTIAAVQTGVQGAVIGAATGLTNTIATGSYGDALKAALTGGAAGFAAGFVTSMSQVGWAKLTGSTYNIGTGIAAANPTTAEDTWGQLTNMAKLAVGKIIENPNTYVKLMSVAQDAYYYHKLANLENDYQEYANEEAAAWRVLRVLASQTTNTITAEVLCIFQSISGKALCESAGSDTLGTLSWDNFRAFALMTGTEYCNAVTQQPSQFVDSKLSISSIYTPEPLYYNQTYSTFAL